MSSLFIYGCGKNCQRFISSKWINLQEIKGFIDEYYESREFFSKPVYRINDIKEYIEENDFILITVYDFEENKKIYRRLKEIGYNDNNIYFIYNTNVIFEKINIHEQDDLVLREKFMTIYEAEICSRSQQVCITKNLYDAIDEKKLVGGKEKLFWGEAYLKDYCRYRAFEFASYEIIKNNVEGQCAELGVFRGEFSALINRKMPDRTLYLYDTFESFDRSEFENEVEANNVTNGIYRGFMDTSVEQVLNILPFPDKCIIRKGIFPNSVCKEDEELSFAFVSLDVDLEQSTYEGLKFFYPRLSSGGYIFVHDYNNHIYFGVKKAIEHFEKELGKKIIKIPLPDGGGTLVISK